MKILLLDTETTGKKDPVAIEIAWVGLEFPSLKAIGTFLGRFNPGKPIELGALATHHILDEDVVNYPPSADFKLDGDVEYLVGHNIDYDWKVIGEPDVKRICTVALSRMLWPEIDSHQLSAMVYHLIGGSEAREMLRSAHSAMADVLNNVMILRFIVEKTGVSTIEELYELSEKARIPTVMTFGKHKGLKLEEVPYSYFKWLLGQPDVDPYMVKAIRQLYK